MAVSLMSICNPKQIKTTNTVELYKRDLKGQCVTGNAYYVTPALVIMRALYMVEPKCIET